MNCEHVRTVCACGGHKMVLDPWNSSHRECEPPDMTAKTQTQTLYENSTALNL